jgi:hypothetical protein
MGRRRIADCLDPELAAHGRALPRRYRPPRTQRTPETEPTPAIAHEIPEPTAPPEAELEHSAPALLMRPRRQPEPSRR